jgi:hypothetical protein
MCKNIKGIDTKFTIHQLFQNAPIHLLVTDPLLQAEGWEGVYLYRCLRMTEPFRNTGQSHSEPPDRAIQKHRTEPLRTTRQSHSEPPDRAIPKHRTEPFQTTRQPM